MRKGLITNLSLYRNFGLHYDGIIKFQIGDKIYESSKLNDFMRDYGNRYNNLSDIKGSDFRVLSQYRQGNSIVFEIELINKTFNPNKVISYLYFEE
ncbi:hypothetical protein H3C61_01305 [Candidatus Gracilibacteria bacterium]|nr:hypothetical protein [Candidatus Gracilibacteria bacterium]